jgi:hypothetical protein
MKNRVIIRIAFIFAIFCSKTIIAQNIFAPTTLEAYMELDPTDTTNTFGDTVFSPHTRLIGKVTIVLQDTINIDKIHLKVGNQANASNWLNQSLDFDPAASTLPLDFIYKREGYIIYLTVGHFTGINHFHAKVELENAQHYKTPPAYFAR